MGRVCGIQNGATAFHPQGATVMTQIMVDVTALGGGTVLLLAVVLAGGFLAVQRRWLTLVLVVVGTTSGSIAVTLIKGLVARVRPPLDERLVAVSSASFPSGHAANSAIVYLTLALLLVQTVHGHAARVYILAATAVLVVLIGVSRLYLHVHWPSDVVGGWVFGTIWALGWWALGRKLGADTRAQPR